MKKSILLLLLLFFTGCTVNYDLTIDNGYLLEKTNIIKPQNETFPYTNDDDYVSEGFYVEDLKDGINLFYDGDSELYDFEVNKLYEDYSINGKFNLNNYNRSNIVSSYSNIFNALEYDGTYVIYISGFNVFDKYDYLDNVTFNIHSKYKAKKNNADSFSDGVYTWNITPDNYMDKSIEIVFNINDVVKESSSINKSDIVGIIIGLFVVVFIVIGVIFKIRRDNIRNNDF